MTYLEDVPLSACVASTGLLGAWSMQVICQLAEGHAGSHLAYIEDGYTKWVREWWPSGGYEGLPTEEHARRLHRALEGQ